MMHSSTLIIHTYLLIDHDQHYSLQTNVSEGFIAYKHIYLLYIFDIC